MSMQVKRSFKAYPAWDYQSEIDELNRMSEQGWQLIRGGCFAGKFVKNPDVRYRYQLDFRRVEDKGRYIETFREQGWEYVDSTFNGWHFFRKLYDPALPEEEYEIFTDRESLNEMRRRWARIGTGIGIALALAALALGVRLVMMPHWPALAMFLMFAVESAFLLRGGLLMRKQGDARRRGERALFAAFLAVLLLGAAAAITLTELRPYQTMRMGTEELSEPMVDNRWHSFQVNYRDNYFLDLEFEATEPFTFAILDEAGEAVYTRTATSFQEKNIRLPLTSGLYEFSISCDSGFEFACELK